MPFREWNFAFRESLSEFRELLRECPGTLRELREWPSHSESIFPEIGVIHPCGSCFRTHVNLKCDLHGESSLELLNASVVLVCVGLPCSTTCKHDMQDLLNEFSGRGTDHSRMNSPQVLLGISEQTPMHQLIVSENRFPNIWGRESSGRKKAHKHKLFALVNVQMALVVVPGLTGPKSLCVRLETQGIQTFPSG